MKKVEPNNIHPMKPPIGIIRNATLSEIMPLIIPIAEKMNLRLNRVSDFKKAVKTLENCILHEIWHIEWSNVNWIKYTDVKAEQLTIKDFNIDRRLLSDFLKVRSKNIIHTERIQVDSLKNK